MEKPEPAGCKCAENNRLLRLILVIVAAIASGHGVDIADIIPGY